jgi:hypothetical protein
VQVPLISFGFNDVLAPGLEVTHRVVVAHAVDGSRAASGKIVVR